MPPIIIEEEPAAEVPAQSDLSNNADLPSNVQENLAQTFETSVPVETDPPEPVCSPITKDDSLFELTKDPAPKRRKIFEAEASLSPKPVTPPFRPCPKSKKERSYCKGLRH